MCWPRSGSAARCPRPGPAPTAPTGTAGASRAESTAERPPAGWSPGSGAPAARSRPPPTRSRQCAPRRRPSARDRDAREWSGPARPIRRPPRLPSPPFVQGPTATENAWKAGNASNWKYEGQADVTETLKILFVGDVVGGPGRRALLSLLPALHERHQPRFVVVNGENAAGGLGITPKVARELFAAG